MLRFYKTWADRIIVGLILLIRTEEANGRATVINTLRGWRTDNEDRANIAARAIEAYGNPHPDEDPTNEDVLIGTIEQVGRKKTDDLDLIDTIVRTLQLPYSANRFNLSYLKGLRDAILRPEELIKWRKANTATLSCAKCMKILTNGEMTTARASHDGALKFECHKCAFPTYGACAACGVVVPLQKAFNPQKPLTCGCAKTEQQAPPTDVTTAQAQFIPLGDVNPAARIMFIEGRAPAEGPTPPPPNAAARRAAQRRALQEQYRAVGIDIPGDVLDYTVGAPGNGETL